MIKDTRLHPFEVSFAEMVRKAKASEKARVQRPRVKPIPEHIRPRLDEDENRFGMYNYRLDHWVREEYATYHSTFREEGQALSWYRSLI